MSSHTPGPWRAKKREDAAFQYLIVDVDDLVIAYTAHANRGLIKAAPDMYEALKDLVGMFCADDCDHTGCDYRAGAEALASAEGQ